jgi:hypothetical protein
MEETTAATEIVTATDAVVEAPSSKTTPSQQRRQALFDDVKRLAGDGKSIRAISKELGIHRATVRRNVRASAPPPIMAHSYPVSETLMAGYSSIVDEMLGKGERNLSTVFKRITEAGYHGSLRPLYTYVRKHYPEWKTHKRDGSQQPATLGRAPHKPLSARSASYILTKDAATLSEPETHLRQRLISQDLEVATAGKFADRFAEMVRKRQPEKLDEWLHDSETCQIAEVRNFAAGISRDYAAVRAGLTHEWSNGPVEGHVNRLKLIKRTMYGRGGMGPLKRRFLYAR